MLEADVIQWIILGGAAGLVVLAVLGGLMTPVAGRWFDSDREITLKQLGPWVFGRCEREGGYELYRGWALFGLVWLDRVAYGQRYLQRCGFAPETSRLVEGQPLARFAFQRGEIALHGTFQGRKFTFHYQPRVKVAQVTLQPSQPRTWVRAA